MIGEQMTDWAEQIVIVTGGSRGIGRAISRALAPRGAAICINYATRAVEAEGLGILGEADLLEPIPYCAYAASSSRSAFASFRSWVSKPSVNQP